MVITTVCDTCMDVLRVESLMENGGPHIRIWTRPGLHPEIKPDYILPQEKASPEESGFPKGSTPEEKSSPEEKASPEQDHQITALANWCREKQMKNIVLVGGNPIVKAASTLKTMGVRVTHLGAGQRSGNPTDPKEQVRYLADKSSFLCLCYHNDDRLHLLKEGIRESSIHVVGTLLEATLPAMEQLDETAPPLGADTKYIFVDVRDPMHVQKPERLTNLELLAETLRNEYESDQIVWYKGACQTSLKDATQVDHLTYKEYLQYLYFADYVITDSGATTDLCDQLLVPMMLTRPYCDRKQYICYCLDLDEPLSREDLYRCSHYTYDKQHPTPSGSDLSHFGPMLQLLTYPSNEDALIG